MFAFGSIVLGRFPFTDLSGDKRRPALVVSRDISAAPTWWSASSPPFPEAARMAPIAPTPGPGLKAPSLVRFDKLATIEMTVIAGKIGDAASEWLDANRATLFGAFGFTPP